MQRTGKNSSYYMIDTIHVEVLMESLVDFIKPTCQYRSNMDNPEVHLRLTKAATRYHP